MAGIGFELRRLLRTRTYAGLLRAYGYAGMICAGPWTLSILIIMLVGILALSGSHNAADVNAFLISVTYLVATSLVVTGVIQLVYTRFVADRIYERKTGLVLPNLLGLLAAVDVVIGLVALVVSLTLFADTPLLYRITMHVSFLCLCNIWILTVFLSGMKNYRHILVCFAAGYGSVLLSSLWLSACGLPGLMSAFCLGQAVLMGSMLVLVIRQYPADALVARDWTRGGMTHRSLIFTGLFYNLGIWVDKAMFWFNPDTSIAVIGPLRSSPIYDLPMFLAYLSIIPGMAVFLMRVEADFAEHYAGFYDAIRDGDTLVNIEDKRFRMIDTARRAIHDVLKIQGITVAILFLLAPVIIKSLGFSLLYIPLFDIDIVGVALQLLFMVILNIILYLNRLRAALALCALFVVSNVCLTMLSQTLGVLFYGYGFAGSLLLTSLTGMWVLSRRFDDLSYDTFMLQPGPAQTIRDQQ